MRKMWELLPVLQCRLILSGSGSLANPVSTLSHSWMVRTSRDMNTQFRTDLLSFVSLSLLFASVVLLTRSLDFLRLLDSSDPLALFDLQDVDYSLACGLFTVPKASDRDRLVLGARPGNRYEESEDRWIRSLGDVSQLQFAFLHPGSNYRVFSEDLREFYHAFVVGEERASRISSSSGSLPRLAEV